MLQGQPLHPLKHALQLFTDASKEGWGAHLYDHTTRGTWSFPESRLYINYRELKVVFLALKEFQDLCQDNIVIIATDNTTVVAYINKEGGMRSGPLCSLLWRILTWAPTSGYSQSLTHPRLAEYSSRQAIQARPDYSNRMASPSIGLPGNMRQVAPATDRPFCDKVQQQAGSICVTSSGSRGLGSRRTQPAMGGPGSLCLFPNSHFVQSCGEVAGLPMQQNHSDCSGWPNMS